MLTIAVIESNSDVNAFPVPNRNCYGNPNSFGYKHTESIGVAFCDGYANADCNAESISVTVCDTNSKPKRNIHSDSDVNADTVPVCHRHSQPVRIEVWHWIS